MLTAIPQGLFSGDYTITQDNEQVAELDLSLWKEQGTMIIADRRFQVRKEGWVNQTFLLEQGDQVIARARKPSVFKRRFELVLGETTCELRPKNVFCRTYHVYAPGTDTPVGRIARQGWFTRRTDIDLPDDWPAGLQVFVFWLVLLMWRRDAAAASSSS